MEGNEQPAATGEPRVNDRRLMIFISYRRSDTRGYAEWLAYSLEGTFGQEHIFRTSKRFNPGVDVSEAVSRAISQADVVLVLSDPTGRRSRTSEVDAWTPSMTLSVWRSKRR